MSTPARRLAALEAAHGPSFVILTEREKAWLAWLDVSSLEVVLGEYAEHKAERRYLHDTGRRAGQPGPNGRGWIVTTGDGWIWPTTDDERCERTVQELRVLLTLWGVTGVYEAIREWIEEADTTGWPELGMHPNDYDAFTARLAMHRAMMAVHRMSAQPLAQLWRHRRPEWRPDLTPAEYDAWEIDIQTGKQRTS